MMVCRIDLIRSFDPKAIEHHLLKHHASCINGQRSTLQPPSIIMRENTKYHNKSPTLPIELVDDISDHVALEGDHKPLAILLSRKVR